MQANGRQQTLLPVMCLDTARLSGLSDPRMGPARDAGLLPSASATLLQFVVKPPGFFLNIFRYLAPIVR